VHSALNALDRQDGRNWPEEPYVALPERETDR